jgi:hypothetical protein
MFKFNNIILYYYIIKNMGDDYTGPVTVAADDGSERVLADINVWQQSETISEMVKDGEPGDIVGLGVGKEELDKVVAYMVKMAAIKTEGTSDEEFEDWENGYKEDMEPLPGDNEDVKNQKLTLLFQTMTAANFMSVQTLVDELCKFVAEMIAQRTPNEILDYFNIKKDATWGEEQALIAQHKWIDPGDLIWKDKWEDMWRKNPANKDKSEEELKEELEAAYLEYLRDRAPSLTGEERRKEAAETAKKAVAYHAQKRMQKDKAKKLGLPDDATDAEIQREERRAAAEARQAASGPAAASTQMAAPQPKAYGLGDADGAAGGTPPQGM